MPLVLMEEISRERMGGIISRQLYINTDHVGHIIPDALSDEEGEPVLCFRICMVYGSEFRVTEESMKPASQ